MLTDKQLFLFDIDGTLCLGDTWIDGARELLALLKAQGKHYLFLTNNSTKSQLDYVEKFQKMGLTVDKEEILTASMATGILLRDLYPNRKFYALGTRSFEEEMRSYGVELTTDLAEAEGLLAAYDAELTYGKLVDACHILQRAELPFIATNPDLVCPDEVGFVPDCGSICQMLENCHRPETPVCGKAQFFYGEICASEAEDAQEPGGFCGRPDVHGHSVRRQGRGGHHRRADRRSAGKGSAAVRIPAHLCVSFCKGGLQRPNKRFTGRCS